MGLWFTLAILAAHFLADFVLQTDWQALNKSSSNDALLAHTSMYTTTFIGIGGMWWVIAHRTDPVWPLMVFLLITFLAHTLQDWVTSRWTARLWKAGRRHAFFVVIGFDQLLHYVQLLGMAELVR